MVQKKPLQAILFLAISYSLPLPSLQHHHCRTHSLLGFFFFFWKWHNNEWVGRLPVGSRWQHNTSWSGLIGLRVSIHFIWVEGWVTCVLWFPMWVIFFVVSMLIERYDNGYEDGITIGKLFFCFYFVFVLWRMWILVNHHLLKLLKIKLEKKIKSHIISDN